MSRDDSQLQIKSLEQILQLGHTIAQQEAKKHASPTNTSVAVATNMGRKSTPKRTNRTPSPVATRHVHVPDNSSSARRAVPVDAAVGGISRLVKVPGLTPAPTTGKANKVQTAISHRSVGRTECCCYYNITMT